MWIRGGYKTQTVTQIVNVLSGYDAGEISLRAMRVYFSTLVSVAAREAAKRSRARVKRRGEVTPRFLSKELSGLTGLSQKVVQKEIRNLKRAGLFSFSESEIVFEKSPKVGSEDLLLELSGKRSPKRPVPIPRTVLRFLAKSSKASTIKTTLAYVIRGLTITRQGEIRGAGSVKATWISDTMNLSERSVRSARSELLALGFITDDEGSTQQKLNRTGAYFSINLDWKGAGKREERVINRGGSEGASESPVAEGVPPVDNSFRRETKFAPLGVKIGVNFAPPYKDLKTLNRSKNQESREIPPNPSGLCMAKTENGNRNSKQGGGLPPPNIRDVRVEDLRSFGRVEELYRQAVKIGLIEASEAGVVNFISAAVRATKVEGDAPRVFIGILKKKLWNFITQGDEDRALGALRKYRRENPDRFRSEMLLPSQAA